MGADFIRRYSLASSSAVQTAAAKLRKMDLLTVRDGAYLIPDIMLRMYLQRISDPGKQFL